MTAQLAQTVLYTDRTGKAKAAMVIGTPESVNQPVPTEAELAVLAEHGCTPKSSRYPHLEDGQVILTVWSPSGRSYTRTAILDEIVGTFVRVPKPEPVDPAVDLTAEDTDPANDEDDLNPEF